MGYKVLLTDYLQSKEQVGIAKLPPVLILRLQRLDEHGQKLTMQVQLDPALAFTSTEGAKLEYSLYGVVEHVSTGNEEGHYVAYVKVRRPHLRQYVCKRLYHRYNHRRNTVRGTRWRRASSLPSTGNTCAPDRPTYSSTVPTALYPRHTRLHRTSAALQ
jgi:hypothetical protein